MDINIKILAQERAKRLLALRALSGLSRDALNRRYGVSKATLQNWETARAGGLTKRGVDIILKAYRAENIACCREWLMHGVGQSPRVLTSNQQIESEDVSNHAVPQPVLDHILHYRKVHIHQDVFDMQVADDSMGFFYPKNAYIGGLKVYRDQVESLLGCDCIIQIPHHDLVFRRLMPGSTSNCYHLVPLNLNQSHKIYTDVEVISAAKVAWIHAESFTYSPC